MEHCTSAYELAKHGQILSSLALARTAFEHALLARFLDQSLDGHELSEIVLDKHLSDLGRMAELAGSRKSSEELQKLVRYEKRDHDRVPTSPNKIIDQFDEKEHLRHLYFLLSQASHPISAFFQYIELGEDGVSKQIRRKSLNQDADSAIPFIFDIFSLALRTDASLSKDQDLEKAVSQIVAETITAT